MPRKVLLAALIVAVAITAASERPRAAARTRVFIAFVSHNENGLGGSGAVCGFTDTEAGRARFAANRAALVQIARLIASRGAAYDFQTDSDYILRVYQWENEALRQTTGGMNVLQYLSAFAPRNVVVDPHSHETNGFNYADVAHMLNLMSVTPTNIVGGYLAWPLSAANWERFQRPLRGNRFPQFLWQAAALWGGGSPNHVNDPHASGIWRPRSHTDFFSDDPASPLPNIGNGGIDSGPYATSGAADVVARLYAGTLEPNRMYTATLMMSHCDFDRNPGVLSWVTAVVDAAAPFVARGDVVWATLPEMLRVWRDEYDSTPVVLRR